MIKIPLTLKKLKEGNFKTKDNDVSNVLDILNNL